MNQSRILVVEDEAIVTMEIEERLAAMGYKVAGIVSSGEQALNLAREQRPDLVLMDIRLDGDMDGISAAEEIRKQFQVPVIFLTAYSEDSTLERAKRAEPYGYLLKPFDDRELRSTIEIALYKHRTEEELRRMNRLYDVLSQVNQTVVRTEAREELFDTVCHMVVERGTMDLAWIGCLDAQKSHIHPVASFGNHGEKLSDEKFWADSSPEAGANLCKTVKEGKPFICNECGKSPCPYPREQSPERFGFQSCASFPLWFQGGVFGALNICVQEPGFFREKEIMLLDEVARDISFALDKIEGEARRKHAEELLRGSEERYRLAMEATSDGIWDWDLLTDDVYYSPAYFHMLGYEPGDFPGRAGVWIDLIHPEDRRHVLDVNKACIKNQLPSFSVEFRMRSSDGSWRWILGRGKAVRRDADGRALQMIGTHEDITERKQKEKELEQLHRQNERILNTAGEGIVGLDKEGITTFANPAALAILGFDSNELIGSSLHELIHHHKPDGSLYPEKECPTYATLKDGVSVRLGDETLWRKDGASFPAAYSATPIVEDGKVSGAVVTFRDITVRKRALNALRESEVKYRNIFENAVEGIFQITPEGKCISVNPALAHMCGFRSPDDMVSSIVDVGSQLHISSEDRARLRAFLEAYGIAKNIETQIRRTDGRLLWISINARAVKDERGNLLYYEGTIEDISERKRLEEEHAVVETQLRQAQKLEALGTLAGGVAHDFNNILSIIIGYAELSEMETEAGSGLKKNLREIINASARAKELVKQILAFSRRSEHQKLSLQLHIIVKEAMKMLRPSLPSTIEIKTEVLSKSAVFADPTQMHQVLMNLCTNAAHSMRDKGGVLEIRLRDIELGEEAMQGSESLQPGRYVELTVKDDGHGIDPRVIDLIFDPFFTTKELGEGTGLGLSVVHGIVKSHGGAINVVSTVGEGSTFTVLIPAMETTNGGKRKETAVSLPWGKERVLVVDDEPSLAEMVRTMLSRLGYEVVSCTSGIEALQTYRNQPEGKSFDLVVTDMTMPHLTGEDLAGELLKLHPEVPVILMTGFSERMDAEKAKSLGIKGFIMKPVILKELAALIRKVVDRTS